MTTTRPIDFDLTRDAQGRLVLRRPGVDDAVDVRVRRAFPWSDAGHLVSIRSSEGKELLMVEDPGALPAPLRAALDRELAAASFVPRITRVHDVDMRFGHQQWSVQTDRGPAQFRVQEREDVRFMHDGRFRVKDADGNLYELAPVDELDAHSQRQLEVLL